MPLHVMFICTLPVLFISAFVSLKQVEGTVCGQNWILGGGEPAHALVKQYHMAFDAVQKLLASGGMHWPPLQVNFMSNTSQSSSTHQIQGALKMCFIMLHTPCCVAVQIAAALIIGRPHFDAVLSTHQGTHVFRYLP